jgi:chemotaxis protein CheD
MDGPVMIRAGELGVGRGEMLLATLGLGSCVAVALDDPASRVGGLAHVFLPESSPHAPFDAPGRYVDTALPLLLERVVGAGADRRRLRARLVGGASMFPALQPPGTVPLGLRNANAARGLLDRLGVPVAGEDVGGSYGRSVYFHVGDGRLVVRSVQLPDRVL